MGFTLDTDESIKLLEDIARNSQNAAARIAAIKQLEIMRESYDAAPVDDKLYGDELAIKRSGRK